LQRYRQFENELKTKTKRT